MNMQKLMQEAQKMQMQLQKDQKELEKTVYEGISSNVKVKMNGKYELTEVKLDMDEISVDDKDLIEDMLMVAVNDAVKKIGKDKEKKMGKYGQGIAGLM
ncbi:MAG: YbaB/EbfC family nucleoid-associated protein [Bacilli bacterium]|nr:YbaB/EbfC family nucleoid-associated protein [Bacilli bacterium]